MIQDGLPLLSVVIVNWNTRDLLANCLASVYSTGVNLPLEVIVVDNGSSDGSPDMVRTSFPAVHLVSSDINLGFAKANNLALDYCSAEYVMLLNSDVTLHPGTMERLVAFLDETPSAGAVAPKIVHPNLRLKVLSCGYQPTLGTVFSHYSGLSAFFPNTRFFRGLNLRSGVHDDVVRCVEWLSGACMVVRKEVIEQVGRLKEDWFMYAEDMEWSRRIAAGGWQLYHVPDVTADHLVGASAKKNSDVSTMWVQNLFSYYQYLEHPGALRFLALRIVVAVGLWIRSLYYWIRGSLDAENRETWWTESAYFRRYAMTALVR